MFVWSSPITTFTVNVEDKYLMLIEILFDIHVLCPCKCILMQRCGIFCYQIKLIRSQISVQYISFHLSQLMTVKPFKHTKELKQFMNMYTTSLTVKVI